jgi:ribose transport system permease protein
MWIYRGVVQLLADGQPVTIRNQDHPEVAEFFKMLGSGRVWGNIPVAFIIMVVFAIILSIVLNKTVFGRNLFATGSNSEAARLSGINVKWTTIYAHMIAGIMAGIAGILITGRLSSGQVNAGSGYELEAVAACAIGRVSLLGGEGSIIGALIGAFMMGILRNGLNLNGVGSFWQQIVIGIVLIVAVTTDLYQRKRIGQ